MYHARQYYKVKIVVGTRSYSLAMWYTISIDHERESFPIKMKRKGSSCK